MNEESLAVVARLRLRLLRVLWLRYTVLAAGVYLAAMGIVVLALRITTDLGRLELLWPLAGLPLVVPLAWLAARRRCPAPTAVLAVLDRENRCGGLLLSSTETDVGPWLARLSTDRLPLVRWNGRRGSTFTLLSLAFLALALLLPRSITQAARGEPSLDISREVQKLNEQIDVLEEERLLADHQAEALREDLDAIDRDADGTGPVTTFEALDQLENQLQQLGEESAEDALAAADAAQELEQLAEGLNEESESLSESELAGAMKALSEKLEELRQEQRNVVEQLSEVSQTPSDEAAASTLSKEFLDKLSQWQSQAQSQSLSPEQMDALRDALRQCKGDLQRMLENMQACELLEMSPEELAECFGDGQEGQCDGLKAFLAEHEGEMQPEALALLWCQGGCPGRGGISRGPGHVPLTWKDPSNRDGAQFKEETLPPGGLSALRDSERIGVSAAAPQTITPGDGTADSTAVIGAEAAGSGAAHTQTILPRHRGAVGRYFDRN